MKKNPTTNMDSALCKCSKLIHSHPYGYILGMSFILLNVCSCSDPNRQLSKERARLTGRFESAKTNEIVLETYAAGQFLLRLDDQGQLPGSSNDEPGTLSCETFRTMKEGENIKLSYPFSRSFNSVKQNSNLTNHYTVVRISTNSDWQLTRAWRTDSSGKVIEEWPVK